MRENCRCFWSPVQGKLLQGRSVWPQTEPGRKCGIWDSRNQKRCAQNPEGTGERDKLKEGLAPCNGCSADEGR